MSHFLLSLQVRLCALALALLSTFGASGQQPPPPQSPPLDPLLQLMLTQPSIDITTNFEVTATFDPPVIPPGGTSIYRITINALSDSVEWPQAPVFPPSTRAALTARGQLLVPGEGKLKPVTAVNYRVTAQAEDIYSVPPFQVRAYGRPVFVPAAHLEVQRGAPASPPQSLTVGLPRTNCYVGEPVKVSVFLRGGAGNVIQGVQDVKLNGEGFLVDLAGARQSIGAMPGEDGVVAYRYETTLTPLKTGSITVSAQGFTAGNRFGGAIIIQGQAVIPGGPPQFRLLDSEPVTLRVQPLPQAGELPGFTGFIGAVRVHPPSLSTNRVRAGEPLKLAVRFDGATSLSRLVPPPPPVSSNWQVFAAERGSVGVMMAPGSPINLPASTVTFTYTMIPLDAGLAETPAIPFSYFDPETGRYEDATIPPAQVVVGPGITQPDVRTLAAMNQAPAGEKKLRLSDLASEPGRGAATLVPLQHRGWFIAIQVAPLLGFLALWQWDRRRRFLEQHPLIVQRRRAKRRLGKERHRLQQALAAGDERRYARHAVESMKIAVAPDYAAEPRALVASDVLVVLNGDSRGGDLVRRFFMASDSAEFSTTPNSGLRLTENHAELEQVLDRLEARL